MRGDRRVYVENAIRVKCSGSFLGFAKVEGKPTPSGGGLVLGWGGSGVNSNTLRGEEDLGGLKDFSTQHIREKSRVAQSWQLH